MMVSIWTLLSILNFAEMTYLASSPDEIALVQGARDVGVVFKVTSE
jgi:magnesium-transporting ATPase (P-type)